MKTTSLCQWYKHHPTEIPLANIFISRRWISCTPTGQWVQLCPPGASCYHLSGVWTGPWQSTTASTQGTRTSRHTHTQTHTHTRMHYQLVYLQPQNLCWQKLPTNSCRWTKNGCTLDSHGWRWTRPLAVPYTYTILPRHKYMCVCVHKPTIHHPFWQFFSKTDNV